MMRRRIAAVLLAAGLATGVALGAGAATNGHRDPILLAGTQLPAETGLRLLVANNPPFVFDVDTGHVIPSGVPAVTGGSLSVVGVGGRAAVVVARSLKKRPHVYAVQGREARLSPLGIGTNAWPASNGRGVWVQTSVRSSCRLREMGLDGRVIRNPRAFPCATVNDPAGGSLGLVVGRTRVFNPQGHLVLQTRRGIWAVAGTKLVLAGPKSFTLLHGRTRAAQRLRWPSILRFLDRPAVDPRGRFVALSFADPAWRGGGQALDVWLLDARTGTLSQVPGMPALVSLKRTDIAWSDDGRLVLFGHSGENVLAVWRPGQRRLALKTVQIPERTGGSDSFAILG